MKRFLCLAALVVAAPTLQAQGARLGVMLSSPEEGRGAQIVEVLEPSAASVMGLETGDVVLAFEGLKIESIEGLVGAVQKTKPGQIFELTLRREGKVHTKIGVMGLAVAEPAAAPQVRETLDALGYIGVPEEVVEEEIVEEPVLQDVPLGEAAGPHGWHQSLALARRAAQESGKPVLVDFYADWCGPCKALGREVLHNAEYADLLAGFEAVQVNVDTNPELAKEYSVRGIPDVRILGADGKERKDLSFVGYSGVDGTVAKLKKARGAGKAPAATPRRDQERERARVAAERALATAEAARALDEARAAAERGGLEKQAAELQARMSVIQAELAAIRKQLEAMRRQGANG